MLAEETTAERVRAMFDIYGYRHAGRMSQEDVLCWLRSLSDCCKCPMNQQELEELVGRLFVFEAGKEGQEEGLMDYNAFEAPPGQLNLTPKQTLNSTNPISHPTRLPPQTAERSAKQEIMAKVDAMAQDVSIRFYFDTIVFRFESIRIDGLVCLAAFLHESNQTV